MSDRLRGQKVNEPLHTITLKNDVALTEAKLAPFISSRFGENRAKNVRGKSLNEPLPTITAGDHNNLIEPKLEPYIMTNTSGHACTDIKKPLSTITTGNNQYLISPHVTQYHSETSKEEVRAYDVNAPLNVIDTNPRYAITTANLVNYYNTGRALDIEKPLPTQTTKDRTALVENHLCVLRNNMDCKGIDKPLPTITTSAGHFAHIKTYLLKYEAGTDLQYWPQIRELLNQYCDYKIADDEVLILEIDGVPHFISDIDMRMLTPRELYRCQGFPEDYIINFEINGKSFPIAEQVKKVGNSVCPQVATALVRANLPELAYKKPLKTMEELEKVLAI